MSGVITLAAVADGFAEPVHQAQSVFRQVLDAFARPGTRATIAAGHGQPRFAAGGALALTLLDFETPVWFSPEFAAAGFADWLRFHCSCPVAATPLTASFVLATAADRPDFAALDSGDAKYPDRAATLVLECPALEGGLPVTLQGPGIKDRVTIAPAGLDAAFWQALRDNRSQFQLGVDVVLTSGAELLALPRSTRVVEGVN